MHIKFYQGGEMSSSVFGKRVEYQDSQKLKRSEFDAFGTGHSSTSISAALGLAEANSLKGKKALHIAVIGDGALTGGLAFEG